MKHKVSLYHIPVFLYRRGFLILTLPLQTLLPYGTNPSIRRYLCTSILFFISLFIYSCVFYKSICVTSDKKALSIKEGTLLPRHTVFSNKGLRGLTFSRGPLQKLTKICRVNFSVGLCHSSVYLKTNPSSFIYYLSENNKNEPKLHLRNHILSVLMLSLGFYNAFTGTLTLVPFFRKVSTLSRFPDFTQPHIIKSNFYKTLPLLLFYLWVTLIVFWALGVILNILRFWGLSTTVSEHFVFTIRGLIVRHETYIPKRHLCAVIFRQNLLLLLINRYTGEFISSLKKSDKRTAFLCAAKKETCLCVLKNLNNKADLTKNLLVLRSDSFLGCTFLPLTFLFIFSILSIIADIYSPYIARTRIGLFCILWLIGWFIFRACVFSRCFASLKSEYVSVGYYRGLTYCIAFIPKNKIRKIKISQTIFQKYRNTCSIKVFIKGQRKACAFIKHTNKEKAAEFLKKLCGCV